MVIMVQIVKIVVMLIGSWNIHVSPRIARKLAIEVVVKVARIVVVVVYFVARQVVVKKAQGVVVAMVAPGCAGGTWTVGVPLGRRGKTSLVPYSRGRLLHRLLNWPVWNLSIAMVETGGTSCFQRGKMWA